MNYKAYAQALREGGVPERRVQEILQEAQRVDLALNSGRCPTCGRPISATTDPRQAGFANVPGGWVNYRCLCGFAIDRRQTGGETR